MGGVKRAAEKVADKTEDHVKRVATGFTDHAKKVVGKGAEVAGLTPNMPEMPDDSFSEAQSKAQAKEYLNGKSGRSSTILTGESIQSDDGSLKKKKLLGE